MASHAKFVRVFCANGRRKLVETGITLASRILLFVAVIFAGMLFGPGNFSVMQTPRAAAQETAIPSADQEKVLKFLKKQFSNAAYRMEQGPNGVRVFAGAEPVGDLTKTPSGDFRITGKLSTDAKTRPSLVQERDAIEKRLRALLGNPAVTLKTANDSSGLLELKDEGIGFIGVRPVQGPGDFFYELRLIVLKPDLEG